MHFTFLTLNFIRKCEKGRVVYYYNISKLGLFDINLECSNIKSLKYWQKNRKAHFFFQKMRFSVFYLSCFPVIYRTRQTHPRPQKSIPSAEKHQRSVFSSDTALLKALYPATTEMSKKWTMPLRDWGKVLGEL